MPKVIIEFIEVNPEEICIMDVSKVDDLPNFFAIYPSNYNCRILLSPWVVQRLFKWLIKNNYAVVNGEVIIKTRTQTEHYYG